MKKKSWTPQQLRDAVESSHSIRSVIQKLGLIPAGGNYKQIKHFIKYYRIPTSHFRGQGWSKDLKGIGKPRKALKEILTTNSTFQSYKLKNRLIKEGLKQAACEECCWAQYSEDGRLPLELDHINGISSDNRIKNLRILCPNCHSLKATHRGRNMRKHR